MPENFLVELDVPVEFMRFCLHCERVARFVCELETAAGLVGTCIECGDLSLAPFTRTMPPRAA